MRQCKGHGFVHAAQHFRRCLQGGFGVQEHLLKHPLQRLHQEVLLRELEPHCHCAVVRIRRSFPPQRLPLCRLHAQRAPHGKHRIVQRAAREILVVEGANDVQVFRQCVVVQQALLGPQELVHEHHGVPFLVLLIGLDDLHDLPEKVLVGDVLCARAVHVPEQEQQPTGVPCTGSRVSLSQRHQNIVVGLALVPHGLEKPVNFSHGRASSQLHKHLPCSRVTRLLVHPFLTFLL
mmetsp:Transcript_19206/g.48787  ORF Transcript_19206/g.48787 Transcript_19206/m.48787 type:complete len:234 (-) Transcript_19206:100-801(-)